MNKEIRDFLIVPLDVPDFKCASNIVDELSDMVVFYKIGLQLFIKAGPEIIEFLKKKDKKIFLDLKLHDIPNTVMGAINSIADMNVDMTTIHTMGGFEMMESAQKVIWNRNLNKPVLLGVTILTSLDEAFLQDIIGTSKTINENVVDLAGIAKSAGLSGVVASPNEVSIIKRRYGNAFIVVTPGIRPKTTENDDQKRTSTPRDAIANGSDHLVIGRPILNAENKRKTVESILKEVEDGLHLTA